MQCRGGCRILVLAAIGGMARVAAFASGTALRAQTLGGPGCGGARMLHRSAPAVARRALAAAEMREQAPPGSPSVVILPGFGNAAVDYINPFGAGFETSISYALEQRGFDVTVMPLERTQWFNVLRGLFTLSFWLGNVTPYEPSYGWYVQRARDTILAAEMGKGKGVIVIGHSAGGWLGRAALGDGTDFDADVRAFVSLGAPHSAPPKGIPGVMDMTRGALTWTDEQLPGVFLADRGVQYVTVASDLITGSDAAEKGTPARAAYDSYRLVCGAGAVPGDGVVPLQSAHLEGAAQITIKCYHSIRPPQVDDSDVRTSWYGSDSMADAWVVPLLAGLKTASK